MNKVIILLSFVCLISLNSEILKNDIDTKNLAEKSAIEFGKGNYKKSVDVLRDNWPIPVAEIDNLVYQTESQMKLVMNRFGKKVGYDFVKTEKIGNSFIKHIYIAKFENHAIRLNYIFYKPENSWELNSFNWDDKVHLLFDSNL